MPSEHTHTEHFHESRERKRAAIAQRALNIGREVLLATLEWETPSMFWYILPVSSLKSISISYRGSSIAFRWMIFVLQSALVTVESEPSLVYLSTWCGVSTSECRAAFKAASTCGTCLLTLACRLSVNRLTKQPPTPWPHIGPTNPQSHCCDLSVPWRKESKHKKRAVSAGNRAGGPSAW